MKIYRIEKDVERYESLILANMDADWEICYRFDGTPFESSWRPLEVEVCCEDDDDREYLKGDFPQAVGLGASLVLSYPAAHILKNMLIGNGELLPLNCPDGDYYAFNLTCVADVLNLDHSDIAYFSTGRIMTVRRYVFNANGIPSNDIFKIAQIPLLDIFVSENFKLLVEGNKLKGLLFHPVEIICQPATPDFLNLGGH